MMHIWTLNDVHALLLLFKNITYYIISYCCQFLAGSFANPDTYKLNPFLQVKNPKLPSVDISTLNVIITIIATWLCLPFVIAFMFVISNLCNTPARQVLLFPFYRWKDWGWETLAICLRSPSRPGLGDSFHHLTSPYIPLVGYSPDVFFYINFLINSTKQERQNYPHLTWKN